MARIIGDKALNRKLTRLARGTNVTPELLRAAERTRQEYVESVQEQSPGRPETRYGPRSIYAKGSASRSTARKAAGI